MGRLLESSVLIVAGVRPARRPGSGAGRGRSAAVRRGAAPAGERIRRQVRARSPGLHAGPPHLAPRRGGPARGTRRRGADPPHRRRPARPVQRQVAPRPGRARAPRHPPSPPNRRLTRRGAPISRTRPALSRPPPQARPHSPARLPKRARTLPPASPSAPALSRPTFHHFVRFATREHEDFSHGVAKAATYWPAALHCARILRDNGAV